MSLYCATGSADTDLSPLQLKDLLTESLCQARRAEMRAGRAARPEPRTFPRRRAHRLRVAVLWRPAQGHSSRARHPHRHAARIRLAHMFPAVPQDLFRVHNWRTDIETLGEIPADFIREQSEGKLNYAWPAQVNRLISQGGFDLILSIGQVVPHEVIGMANYTKNILVGTGGREGINRSHYLGAVYGMERHHGPRRKPRAQRAQLCFRSFPAASAHRLCAHRGRTPSRRRTGRARPLYRR